MFITKALGIKILDYISALSKLGAIDDEQRNELARATKIAMGNDKMYHAIASRLETLSEPLEEKTVAWNFCRECIDLIHTSLSQPIS